MKKASILVLIVCALAAAGALYAAGTQTAPVATVSMQSAAGIAGLPTTVLDEVDTAVDLCFRPDPYCLDVYDPVTCDNGVTYANSCYAWRACATGCTPGNPHM